MNPKSALRIGVLVLWLSTALSIGLSFIMESSLPELLQSYIAWELEQDISVQDWIVLYVGIPLILVAIASSIGLFLYKPWAKWPYIISTLVGLVLVAFIGPTVEHSYSMVFDYLGTGADGFIIAILLLTDAVASDPIDRS